MAVASDMYTYHYVCVLWLHLSVTFTLFWLIPMYSSSVLLPQG